MIFYSKVPNLGLKSYLYFSVNAKTEIQILNGLYYVHTILFNLHCTVGTLKSVTVRDATLDWGVSFV